MCRRGAWAELTAEVTLMAANQGKVYGSYFEYINDEDAMFFSEYPSFFVLFEQIIWEKASSCFSQFFL